MAGLHNKNLPSLHVLDLSSNQLETVAEIHLPQLRRLYLASNQLQSCAGLQQMTCLDTLHLRKNRISDLSGFTPSMAALKYLNMRENPVEQLAQLNKLKCLPMLRVLVLLGENIDYWETPSHSVMTVNSIETPLSEVEEYRIEVCLILRQLERLDKDTFTDDDRADAEEVSLHVVARVSTCWMLLISMCWVT